MVKGLYVSVDSEEPVEVREFAGLDDYQVAVEGWIESVDVSDLGITMYVNEEGLIRHLPFNPRASFLWWYHVPQVRQQAMLVGNVVVVGMPDDEGETTDIPQATLELLTTPSSYVVLVRVDDQPTWGRHPFPYDDYFEAVVWAMVLSERVTGATEIKVVPLSQLESEVAGGAPND